MHVSKTIRKIKFSYVHYVKILRKSLYKKYVHVNVALKEHEHMCKFQIDKTAY